MKLQITNTSQTEEDKKLQQLVKSSGPLPDHIAIIMDGNGRWAQKKGIYGCLAIKRALNL